MRIALTHWTSHIVGGAERYLESLFQLLTEAGFTTSFLVEASIDADRGAIALPPQVPVWNVATQGEASALSALRAWGPDLVFCHGLRDPGLEGRLLGHAPSLFFAHAYYGTCISGTKLHRRPWLSPCEKAFSATCLLHYLPRGCGGASPISMMTLYRTQAARARLMSRYDVVVTASEHMRAEYLKLGLPDDRVVKAPLPLTARSMPSSRRPTSPDSAALALLFVGRLDPLKGGEVLLRALPDLRRRLGRPIRLTFLGDGPARAQWEAEASRLCRRDARLEVRFLGWLTVEARDRELDASDLLVVPSLWPEPFGLVGLEAGLRGLPAAAFPSGGTREWLVEGVNGHLAVGGRPAPGPLADAIVRAVSVPTHHAELREGALRVARGYTEEAHLSCLRSAFGRALRRSETTDRAPAGQVAPERDELACEARTVQK